MAKGLEGLKRSDGIHAAAVVITREPVTEYSPIQRKPEAGQDPADAPVVTQYEMHGIEELGLLKMDFLGPAQPRRHHRHRRDAASAAATPTSTSTRIPLDDLATLELLQRGAASACSSWKAPRCAR